MSGDSTTLQFNAIKEVMKSMAKNQVYDLVDLPRGVVVIGYKLVYKNQKICFL
jgi:hypothetical protein